MITALAVNGPAASPVLLTKVATENGKARPNRAQRLGLRVSKGTLENGDVYGERLGKATGIRRDMDKFSGNPVISRQRMASWFNER